MRTKVKTPCPERSLERVLEALGQDLIDASDDEIEQAAKDLRMDLGMKGSAAFAGLRLFAKPQPADFFDLEALGKTPLATRRWLGVTKRGA